MDDGWNLEGRRVLVVEDQFIVAFDLEQTLGDWGCAVLGPAASNAQALELLRQARPDAALVDGTLTDGWASPVAEALAAQGVPFAVLSGHDGAELPEPALRGVPCLDKPYARVDLRRLLVRLLTADDRLPR